MTALQERVHLLQVRVAALTGALQVLARGLEDRPRLNRGTDAPPHVLASLGVRRDPLIRRYGSAG